MLDKWAATRGGRRLAFSDRDDVLAAEQREQEYRDQDRTPEVGDVEAVDERLRLILGPWLPAEARQRVVPRAHASVERIASPSAPPIC